MPLTTANRYNQGDAAEAHQAIVRWPGTSASPCEKPTRRGHTTTIRCFGRGAQPKATGVFVDDQTVRRPKI